MIDIRIMAHPSRKNNVDKILKKLGLPEDIVVWDDRLSGGDAWYTARKAWALPISKECTHRLVLQDDVDICDDFITHATAIADQHKTHAVTLINFKNPRNYPNKRNTPYYSTSLMPGQAIMLPRDVIKPCIDWCDIPKNARFGLHDDLLISDYCSQNKILMVCTVPSIVQHLDGESLLSVNYSWKRVSKNYEENPKANWSINSVQRIK